MPAALAKRKFTVNVAGLRTDVDEHVLPPNAGVLELENCVFDVTGAVSKRRGFSALSTAAAPVGSLPNVWQLAMHKGSLLSISASANPLAVWSPTLASWILPGHAVSDQNRIPNLIGRLPFAGDATQATDPDIAVSGNYVALCYRYTPGFVSSLQVILDRQTGRVLYSLQGTGQRMRVIALNGCFVFISEDGSGNINLSKWVISTLATVGTPVVLPFAASAHATNPFLDAVAVGVDTIAVAYQHTDNTVHYVTYTVSTGVVASSGQSKNSAGVAFQATQCLGWAVQITATSPVLLVASAALGVVGHIFGAGVAANATVTTTIDAAATVSVRNVTGWTTGATDYNVLYEITGASPWLTKTKAATKVGGVVTTGNCQLSVGLRSRPWIGPDFNIYALFDYDSSTQGSYFVIPVTSPITQPFKVPVARLATWIGNGKTETAGVLASMLTLGSGLVVPAITRTRIETGVATTYFDTGVHLYTVAQDGRAGRAREAADCTFIPGGMLQDYDGAICIESGWHIYPEGISAAQAPAGGLVPGSTYNWRAVYRWIDAQGRLRRSVPSEVLQVTILPGNGQATITVPYCRQTSIHDLTAQVELYRTVAGGTAYYKVDSRNNIYSSDTIAILDVVSDGALVAGELLYTTGGVLPSQPPPPLFAIEQFDQRLVGIDAEDRGLIRMTSQFVDGIAPAWNENLTIRLNTQWGDATGLATMDDKLLIFFRNAIYYIAGVGPDASGNGNYNAPALIATGTGCAEAQCQSIIYTGTGVMFLSDVGFQNIDRGLNVTDIGTGVQAFNIFFNAQNGGTVTAAIQVSADSQIRFFTSFGTTLVWDYLHQAWSVFTGQASQSAVTWGQTPTYSIGNVVAVETDGLYQDRGSNYVQRIVFPWLCLAGLRGYERLYKVQGASVIANVNTQVAISWNFNFDLSAPTLTYLATPDPDNNGWEARPPKQLATAIKVTIETNDLAPGLVGLTLVGLTFLYGVKPGLYPIDKAKRAV